MKLPEVEKAEINALIGFKIDEYLETRGIYQLIGRSFGCEAHGTKKVNKE